MRRGGRARQRGGCGAPSGVIDGVSSPESPHRSGLLIRKRDEKMFNADIGAAIEPCDVSRPVEDTDSCVRVGDFRAFICTRRWFEPVHAENFEIECPRPELSDTKSGKRQQTAKQKLVRANFREAPLAGNLDCVGSCGRCISQC